jgi:hypothetical protein
MQKSLVGALVIAMALLPSFASATSTPYNVDLADHKVYNVPGTAGTQPTLSQSTGTAEILSATFNSVTMKWAVDVACVASTSLVCTGNIIS